MASVYKLVQPLYLTAKHVLVRYPLLYHLASKLRSKVTIIYPESALAHQYLDGLQGIEIGASSFNPFGLNTYNVNYTADPEGIFGKAEQKLTKHRIPVDIVANGDKLPLADASVDFVLTSHVIEHFSDPITALKEWWRVIRPGGYLFTIVPHKERTFDRDRPCTALSELKQRHADKIPNIASEIHHNVWVTEGFVELCKELQFPIVAVQDVDDKVGNGFTVVCQKP